MHAELEALPVTQQGIILRSQSVPEKRCLEELFFNGVDRVSIVRINGDVEITLLPKKGR